METAFCFADECQKRNRETENVITEVFVKFNLLEYDNCRLKCKIAKSKIIPFVNIHNDMFVKKELGLI